MCPTLLFGQGELDELLGPSSPPAVNGLLGIPDQHESGTLSAQGIAQQGDQVQPLEYGSVLHLVDKEIFESLPDPLVDESGGLIAQVLADQFIELGVESDVVLDLDLFQDPVYAA